MGLEQFWENVSDFEDDELRELIKDLVDELQKRAEKREVDEIESKS